MTIREGGKSPSCLVLVLGQDLLLGLADDRQDIGLQLLGAVGTHTQVELGGVGIGTEGLHGKQGIMVASAAPL